MKEGINKFFKYEQIFYGDIICIFEESSSIPSSSSTIPIVADCNTKTFEFDLICFAAVLMTKINTTKFMVIINKHYA